jgi:uncharacterized membrane protein
MFAATILMASGFAAEAGQTEYDPAKVSDSLKAVFQFGSASTKKALNAEEICAEFKARVTSPAPDEANGQQKQLEPSLQQVMMMIMRSGGTPI